MFCKVSLVRGTVGLVSPSPTLKGRARRLTPRVQRSLVTVSAASLDITLTPSDGSVDVVLDQDKTTVGSAEDSTLQLQGDGVAEEHALITKKSGRLFCQALLGEGDMMADTRTWLNGNQLRSGVDYMVPAGAVLAFGAETPTWTAQFKEAEVNDAMARLMLNAMAQGASEDVKKQLDNL